jgi:nucleoside 2-deoxyribosyltransferase
MKIYVATKWENKARAKDIMNQLENLGHSITYDWTTQEQESSVQAANDIKGVQQADCVVGLFEWDFVYKGALIEVGAALGLEKPVFVLGDALITKTLFFKHPLVKHITSIEQVKL